MDYEINTSNKDNCLIEIPIEELENFSNCLCCFLNSEPSDIDPGFKKYLIELDDVLNKARDKQIVYRDATNAIASGTEPDKHFVKCFLSLAKSQLTLMEIQESTDKINRSVHSSKVEIEGLQGALMESLTQENDKKGDKNGLQN